MLIVPYTSDWIAHFLAIEKQLQAALIGLEYTIEHVGSTAVPKLAAKPIIDLDIIYQNAAEFVKIKAALIKIGYFHNGDQGLKDREVFKRKDDLNNVVLDNLRHHLYVCPVDSKALNRHLLFRDALRQNEEARLAYQAMKYQLAIETNQDQRAYAELKELRVNDFIDELIA